MPILAAPPAWSVNPNDFLYSANVRASVFVDETPVTDPLDVLGAFVGDECRGTAQPVFILDTWIFFMPVYSNVNGVEMTFKIYVAGEDVIVPVNESIIFNDGENYGSAFDPLLLHAVLYLDHAPVVAPIPDQTIPADGTFNVFDLDDYLTEMDGDPVIWSFSGQSDLEVSMDENNVVIVEKPSADWWGSELITFTATDQTPEALSGSSAALFTVLPPDHPPLVLDIPDQLVPFGESFSDIDLDDYLIESDGDPILWTYTIQPPLFPEPDPGWTVDPNDFELSMTITARVVARGSESDNPFNQLAAFYGDECRGVVTPIYAIDSWFYFLTIYASQNGEEITLRYYDAENGITLPVTETYLFVDNFSFGSPINPEFLHAEFLHVTIDEQNVASVTVADPNWLGSESIIFTATDQNTPNGYSDFDFATYSYSGQYDLPPFIDPIPDQSIAEGNSFPAFDLDDYLLELDGDAVLWSVSGNLDLLVTLNPDNVLTVSAPNEDWYGEEELIITATDDTPTHLSDLQIVPFIVTPVNDAPYPTAIIEDLQIFSGNSLQLPIDIFADIEGDPLTYSLTSSDTGVVTVQVSGSQATLNALQPGISTLTVFADDGHGGVGNIQFTVTVNCDGTIDCAGDCNGIAWVDDCGVCSGGNSGHAGNSDIDCNGDCFGNASLDDCNICSGGNSGHSANSDIDCNGDCFGLADLDSCGVCSGGNTGHAPDSEIDCHGDCFGNALVDDCGVCSGGSSGHVANSDVDCNGDCFGSALNDDCGICSGGNTGHVANSEIDSCNVCPDGSLGTGSDNPAPENYFYGLGADCNGDCFGLAQADSCGVCSGGNSGHEPNSDLDCNGDCFGSAALDTCGVCSGGNSGHSADDDMDCNGDCFGTAFNDDCGFCSGGNTGHFANSEIDECNVCPDGSLGVGSDEPAPVGYIYSAGPDCNGDCFGSAFENECGCVGGNTGLAEDACYGCTDPLAVNYDSSANLEDGSCAYAGDFNADGNTDVSDVVLIVDWIISNQTPTDYLLLTCDLTGEGEVTVVDLVLIIQIIIGDYALQEPLTAATLLLQPGRVDVQTEGPAAGFQLTAYGDYEPDPASLPAGWELQRGNSRLLIFNLHGLTLKNGTLFTYSGTLDIQQSLVTDWQGNNLTAELLEVPDVFAIRQVYPNPFNPATTITCDLPFDCEISLEIYDIRGVLIRQLEAGHRTAGTYRYKLDGDDLTSGLYFIRLISGSYTSTHKVILLK